MSFLRAVQLVGYSVFGFLAATPHVCAADFRWQAAPDDQFETVGTVFVAGEIKPDDHKKLIKAIGDHQGGKGIPLYLELNSEGGNFEEAIKISQIMHDKNLSSKIGPNGKCLSACAVIFMSGRSFNTSGLMHTDDSQGGRSSSFSRHESRDCRQGHAGRSPSA